MKTFDRAAERFNAYHRRRIHAATAGARAALNQQLKDLYASLCRRRTKKPSTSSCRRF